jgi:hypothetical protein
MSLYLYVMLSMVPISLFGSDTWLLLTSAEILSNAAAFRMLILFCSCTPFQIRRHINVLLLINVNFLFSDLNKAD